MSDAAYNDLQKKEFEQNIESLQLDGARKTALKDRWLDQVLWMEGRAKTCQRRYHFLRVVAIVGGVILPALGAYSKDYDAAGYAVVIVGIIVALATGLEEFFKYGERWRHYRRMIEALKKEWWLYFQLCSPSYEGKDHSTAFCSFSARVEEILAADVDAFLTKVTADSKPQPPKNVPKV